MKTTSTLRSFLLLTGSSLLAVSSASAQLYWDSNTTTAGFGNTTGVWGTNNFWNTDPLGGAGTFSTATTSSSDVNFGAATLNYAQGTVTVASGGVSANTITFGAGQTTAINLGSAGNAITLSGGITVNAGSASHTISSPVTLAAAQTWTSNVGGGVLGGTFTVGGAITNGGNLLTIGGSGNTRLRGAIGGLGGLTKNGSNVLMLDAANGYSGVTTINGGALQLGYGSNAGSLSTSSTISVGAGAIFAINRNDTVTQGTTFSNTAISGDGGFSQFGTGTTILNLANTYKGATTISGGTLSVATANNLGDNASNLVFNGGLLQITGTALTSFTSFTSLGRTVVFNDSKVVGLDINNAANTFTFDQTLPTAGLMLAGAGTVAFQSSVSALTLNTRTPTGAAQTVTYGGAIGDGTAPRSLTKIGAGTQILQGNNGYTGATNINAGTLTLSGAAGALASTSIGLNSGNLTLDNTSNNLGTRISNSATLTVNGNSALTFSHGGTAGIDYSETIGTLSLQSGFLTYTGSQANATGPRTSNLQFSTLSRSGTATANFAGTGLGTNGRNTIKFDAGVTDATDLGPWAVVNGADFASYNTANGIVAATSSALAANSTNSATNFNTTTGNITFDLALNPSLKTLLVTGGTIRTTALNGNTVSVGGISSTGAVHVISGTGAVQALTAGDALYVNVGGSTLTFSSVIQNVAAGATASTLVKYGAGQLTLGGTNTYTGGTVINAGTLSYSANANLGASGSRNVTFAGTGTLTGFAGTLDQLTVNAGAVATIGSATTVTTTTGSGNIIFATTANLGNASNFYGSFMVQPGFSGNIQFASLGDTVGSGNLQYGGKNTDGNQSTIMQLSGNAGSLTLNNRRVEFIAGPLNWAAANLVLQNNNTTAANKFVISTNLLNNADRNHNFQLGGTNTGDNEFAGVIGNSTLGYMYDGVFSGNNMAANGVLSLIKADAGSWIVSGSNTYTGATTVSGGILTLSNSLALQNSPLNTTASIAGTGTVGLRTTATTLTLGGLTGNKNFASTGGVFSTTSGGYGSVTALTLNPGAGATPSYAGVIANGAADMTLTKTGAGTQTLSGPNTYTGATAINVGKLFINGNQTSASGAVSVAGTSTLGGTGTIGGNTTVDATGILEFNLSTAAGSHDKLDLAASRTLTFSGASTLTITSNGGASPGTYTLVTAPGGITGLAPATLNLPVGWTADPPAKVGNDLVINITSTGGGGPGPLDNFLISAISSPQTVGTPITGITLTARDASNATVTSFTGTVNFGGTGGFSGTSATFTAGVLSGVSVIPTIAGSGLTFTVTDIGTGKTGSATITTIQTQYQFWAGGALFAGDANNDGVSNGQAFLLGAANPTVSALNKLPTVSQSGGALTMTFTMLNAASRGLASLSLEHSSDLGIGDAWATVPVTDITSGPTSGVTFSVTPGSPSHSVTATIANTEAVGGKLSGRLKAVNP